jgi:Zn-finger nucleic acid-binding protein
MQCPIDQTTLMMTERQGIEIDYCPKCRGVWLDRGELDKLIAGGSRQQAEPASGEHRPRETQSPYKEERHYKDDHYYKKKKKESFLENLFDF